MASNPTGGDAVAMQVLLPRRARRPHPTTVLWVVLSGIAGAVVLVAGIGLAWLAFATPFMRSFDMPVRPSPGQMAVGIIAWAIALTAPGACIVIGLARLSGTTESLAYLRRRPGSTTLSGRLGPEFLVAPNVHLPDGRRVPEIVIGPHGVALLQPAPPAHASRHSGSRWEVRMDRKWVPMENPLERAARDAEAVRRWIAAEDNDFLVKVHSAVISSDGSIQRTATCAVIARDQIGPWLAALPPQRTLSDARRERLIDLVREAV